MKPLPFDTLTTKFPGSENWRWCWGDDEDALDGIASDLACFAREELVVAFDTETTGLDVREARILAVSFSQGGGYTATICFGDDDIVPEWLEDWIESDAPKVLANAKYDYQVIKEAWGLTMRGIADVMVASQILDDTEQYHNLDALALRHLKLEKIPTWALIGKGKDFTGWGPVPRSVMALYANEDVVACAKVWEILEERLVQENLQSCFRLEMEVLPVVADMELAGVKLDVAKLGELNAEFEARARAAEEAARTEAETERAKMLAEAKASFDKLDKLWSNYPRGKSPKALADARLKARTRVRSLEKPVNLGSPPQLQELLYGRWQLHRNLGLRHPPKTKKGNPATDEDTLVKLAPYSPFVKALMDYRTVAKLVSTYTNKLPELVHPKTGRLHGSFWQVGARTGRFTSSDPNLQNIPNRSEEGRLIRTAFVPEAGYYLWAADYSQIEPRVAAHMSGEPVWIEAYQTGQDLYIATAIAIWGAEAVEANRDHLRQVAKTVVLATMYGAGPNKIAVTAGITFDEAVDAVDRYWAALPKLAAFMADNVAYARANGVIWTLDQLRRRHIPDIKHRWSGPRRAAENQAGNTPVQGTAADILKRAMVRVAAIAPDHGARLTLTVHDELVGEVPGECAEGWVPALTEAMEGAAELVVPLKVEVELGANWAEAH